MNEYEIKDKEALYWLLRELAEFVDSENSSYYSFNNECRDYLRKAYGEYPYNKQGKKDGYKQ